VRQLVKNIIANVLHYSGALRLYRRLNKSITILVYHGISYDKDPLNMNIAPDIFESQIRYLKKNYKIISLDKAIDIINNKNIDDNYCVITFDDGYKNNIDFALPILIKYSADATIFVTCDSVESGNFSWSLLNDAIYKSNKTDLDLSKYGIDSLSIVTDVDKLYAIRFLHNILKQLPDEKKKEIQDHIVYHEETCGSHEREMLNWIEIVEMLETGLITIGGHTMSHPILSKVSSQIAFNEIVGCKNIIQSKIGIKVNHFAYPNGRTDDFTDETVRIIKDSGYASACTTAHGINTGTIDLYRLKRVSISFLMSTDSSGNFSESLFAVKTAGFI